MAPQDKEYSLGTGLLAVIENTARQTNETVYIIYAPSQLCSELLCWVSQCKRKHKLSWDFFCEHSQTWGEITLLSISGSIHVYLGRTGRRQLVALDISFNSRAN